MSNAEVIYNSINSYDSLKKMIEQKQGENLFIEFKQKPKNDFCDDDRKNLGKALSGFANSAGGILIFGVKEDPKSKFSLDPILNPEQFEHKVQEQISRLTAYNVPNVMSKIIKDQSNLSSGYIIILIPKSDISPHQVIDDKKYYKRSGESFKPMEHFELENMFGRTPKPVFTPDILIVATQNDNLEEYKFTIGIRNIGRFAGTYPYFAIKAENGLRICQYGLNGNGSNGLPKIVIDNQRATSFSEYGGKGDYIIYPNQFLKVTSLIGLEKDLTNNKFNLDSIVISFKTACRENRIEENKIEISLQETEEIVNKNITYCEFKNNIQN
jgi:Putative DNA-binding domain